MPLATAKLDISNMSEEQLKELEWRIAQIGRGIDQDLSACKNVTMYRKSDDLKKIIDRIEDRLWLCSDEIDAILVQLWEALDL